MLNSKKMIPSLSGMISPNLVDKITSMLFDDINDADDGTLIVYFVAEFIFGLAMLGLDTLLKFADGFGYRENKIYSYFVSKFVGSVEFGYIKEMDISFKTSIQKLSLVTDLEEIPISLKVLSKFSSIPEKQNLLFPNVFIPRNKRIVLYDLPGLNFDDNLMISLFNIVKHLDIKDCDLKVCYDKNESISWGLLFDCINGGHLDFNNHIEDARLSMKILNISPD